jgi:membrane protein implicated in regulation of membrane protease activity
VTPSPVFLRYLFFQIPGLCFASIGLILLVRWTSLSENGAWFLLALWIAKDLALYPWLKVGYGSGPAHAGVDALLGASGVALTALAPELPGHVRVGSERWQARLAAGAAAASAGAAIRVVAVHGLTLVVEGADSPSGSDS